MAILTITEFSGSSITNGVSVAVYKVPHIMGQKVTFTTATQSAAFSDATGVVRVQSDTDCYIRFGPNPTADNTGVDIFLAAASPLDFAVSSSAMKISAVAA